MLDQLSPAAPARVRVVFIPVGRIKRSRFLGFVERLQPEHVVRLGDVSPDGRPNRNMFSPLAFPMGMIVYDLTTFYPPPNHVALSPFEIYREPLVIVALADGTELDCVSCNGISRNTINQNGPLHLNPIIRELNQDLDQLRDRYPNALVHKLLIFDSMPGKFSGTLPEGVVIVPPLEACKRTTMKTIMCDISSKLLAEMTTLAKSIQALNTIESPSTSQLNRQFDSASLKPSDITVRWNSQNSTAEEAKTGSPSRNSDRSHVRMSMPIFRKGSNAASPSARPATPTNSDLSTSIEDAVGSTSPGDHRNPRRMAPKRLGSADSSRDRSQDRVSIQGFGSGTVSERSRSKVKGRACVVIGSLYMQAGRWIDALKELVEGASIAKTILDHLWHAKALDNIVVSMLMLAWCGLDFKIPQICYVSAERASSSTTHESATHDEKNPTDHRKVSLQNLISTLPQLLDRILNLYARAANNTGESLPQFPYSESVIRFSKLLSAIYLNRGLLNDEVLQYLVLGERCKKFQEPIIQPLYIQPSRSEIVTVLFRAFPTASSENLAIIDRTIILSGIASVLGSLNFHRKKAMVIRELVSYLVQGLVQARIKGAAEMGVHPAAGLAALNSTNGNSEAFNLGQDDVEAGVDPVLGLLGQIYGVVYSNVTRGPDGVFEDSNEAVAARIVQNSRIRAFGGQNLKMDVLRSCINLSEALTDFHGVLKFTADLLRTAGRGVAPGPRSEDASPTISREEQLRLSTNITRTVGAARSLGIQNLETEYWDEFLLRGIELEPSQTSKMPTPHSRCELPGATEANTSTIANPFIYNSFLRASETAVEHHVLVAGEGAMFKVTLQNPFEFDVEIESLRLESEGAEFDSATQKTIIGPYRTQILSIYGLPKISGQLKMTGCVIKVRGCRERRFPAFQAPWSPQREMKIKTIGVNTLFKHKEARPLSVGSGMLSTPFVMLPPKPDVLGLNVISSQPIVTIKSTTLSQSAIMVLEGERQVFSVTLQNISKETSVDLLLFSFKDSTQAPLQTILNNRDSAAVDVYECELMLAQKQALRRKKKDGETLFISPGATATFDIEILGKPGLTNAVVQIDYAHLGVLSNKIEEKFYTRQVSLALTITVNASVELARFDLLPLAGSIPRCLWSKFGPIANEDIFSPEDYCLVLLDLRNSWPALLHIRLNLINGASIEEEILPGITSRIIFPIKRIFLQNPFLEIPTLDPSRQRQFVVSTGRISAESERATREAFWYREEVLKMIHGTWLISSGSSRHGEIELRSIRLTPRMTEAIKIEDIGINLSVGSHSDHVSRLCTNSFAELKVRIINRASEPLFPLLRLQTTMHDQSHNPNLDISKRLILNGLLQQVLPRIPGYCSSEYRLGMIALARGEYDISASIEETRLDEPPPDAKSFSNAATTGAMRPRANSRTMMDAILGTKERRIWHTREPVLVVVKDGDITNDEDE